MKPMSGWISFAAIMMMIIGTLDFFEGLIAVVRGKYYVVSSSQIIVFDTRTWGWLTLLFGILLIFIGVQLITLGLLAEMLARTYHESQDKPTYVIREILEAPPAAESDRPRKVI